LGKRYLTQASLPRLIGGIRVTTLGDLLKEGVAVREAFELEDDLHHLTRHGRGRSLGWAYGRSACGVAATWAGV
jgi:hypothetical protein